jgi:hypothetical protein
VPIARYFMVVGSALTALLLIAGWCLPEPPANFPDQPEIIERAAIRIRSARTWPERVVLDTDQLTIPMPSIEVAPTEQLVARLPDEMTDQTRVDSLAKRNPDARPIDAHRRPARAKYRHARAFPSTHAVRARNRDEQPTWARSVVGLSGRIGRQYQKLHRASVSRVMDSWHFPEENWRSGRFRIWTKLFDLSQSLSASERA